MPSPSPASAHIFGTFHLDQIEFALGVDVLQEVVHFPDKVTRMPLAPPYLLGFFNLRGVIIPLVDLRPILRFEAAAPVPRKVAIVDCVGAKVGLVFDDTGEVLRIRQDQRNLFHYPAASPDGEAPSPVLSGAIKLDEGARIIQVIDPGALVKIENVPQILQHRQDGGQTARRHQGRRRKGIAFTCGNTRLALGIEGLQEIIKVPEIQRTAITTPLCPGNIALRGRTLPLVDFSRLLGLGARSESVNGNGNGKGNVQESGERSGEDRRVLILKTGTGIIGLLIDSVDSLLSYFEEEVLPIPLLIQTRSKMFLGSLPGDESTSDIILLDHREILSHQEITEITRGHSNLYKEEAGVQAETAASVPAVYISFRLDHLYAMAIRQVHEIIPRPAEIVPAPGMPPWVLGLLNLRGRLVTLLDTRVLYQLPPLETPSPAAKILILRQGEEAYGLAVDSVESILTLDARHKTAVPALLTRNLGPIQKDLEEAVEIKTADGTKTPLLILNPAALTQRLASAA